LAVVCGRLRRGAGRLDRCEGTPLESARLFRRHPVGFTCRKPTLRILLQ
jgi:hypothetical protein